jgi:hypothetical protein
VETEGLPGRTAILYHMTDETAGKAITASQQFHPGPKGMFGAGIYFAQSEKDCVGKAQHDKSKGTAVLTAKVKLGRSLVCKASASQLTLATVKKYDCTSAKGDTPAVSRPEYVVYEPWQVTSIRVKSFHKPGGGGGGGVPAMVAVPMTAWPSWVVALDRMATTTYSPPPVPAAHMPPPPSPGLRSHGGPLTKKGAPDMRYKQNKDAAATRPASAGPLTKKGVPDMRYKQNKDGGTSVSGSRPVSAGPLTKKGVPDMRYSQNRAAAASSSRPASAGPLTRAGAPDMRYSQNRAAFSTRPASAGPLTRAGAPDMRYSQNRAAAAAAVSHSFSPMPSYSSMGMMGSGGGGGMGFGGSAQHAFSGFSGGPTTAAGLPDMRYSCNRM